MTAGIILDMPEREYHARRELSSTQARRLLESPAKFKWEQTHPRAPKAAWDLGTAAHTKVLGVGARAIAYPPEHLTPSGNVSTKAATVEWAAEQRDAGLTPITPEQMNGVDAMAEAILAKPKARALLEQPGHPEVSVFATDPDTGVDMRARFDYLSEETRTQRAKAVDLKTADDASQSGFERSIAKWGYDVQDAHYLRTHKLATGIDLPFLFVVVEKEPPHLVAVHVLDDAWAEMGRVKAERARRIYQQCIESGEWPGHPDEILVQRPPTWLVAQFQEGYDRV